MDKTVLHYEILEKLGQGGMGVVYKAFDTKLERPVALKFLAETLIPDREIKARFVHEAQAASKLDHPNICTIHGIEETAAGQLFICMALCEGETLARRIESGNIEIEEALDIANQIALGLEEAHAALIVHRDIKPSNIIVSSKRQAKIMDFGLAKLADASRFTKSDSTVGTVHYMSPEQVKGDEIDRRTDIWSLGVVLYELLTGRLPFGGDYEASILYAIVNEDFKPASRFNDAVPAAVDRIIAKALKKNPRERYASTRAMREDLNEARQELAAAKRGASTSSRRLKRIRPTRAISMILCGVVLLSAAAVVLFGPFFSAAPKPVTIAVLGFGNVRPDTSGASLLAELLAMDLRQSRHIRALGKERALELYDALKIDTLSRASAFALCEQARVPTLVVPRMERIGGAFHLSAAVYDVAGRRLLYGVSVPCGDCSTVRFEAIDRLSSALQRKWNVLPRWRIDRLRPKLAGAATTASEAAYRSFSKGEAIYRSGNPKGIPLIEEAVKLDSTFVRALLRLALWYDYVGDERRALLCLRKAKECSRTDESESMKISIVEFELHGDYEQAAYYMKSHLLGEPDDVRMQLELGYVLYRYQKRLPEAIEQLNKVFALDSLNLEGCWGKTYSCLGNVYLYLGQFESAMTAFQNYGELCPGTPDALHDFASVYCYRGDYAEAIARYREVVRLDPDFFVAHEDLGAAYLAVGRWREALESFERYAERSPASLKPKGHVLMGTAWLAGGESGRAARESELALEIDSTFVRAHWLAGRIALVDRRGLSRARRELRSMRRILDARGGFSDGSYYHDLHGLVLLAEKRYDEGLEEFRSAVREAAFLREYISFRRDYARACLEAGKVQEAVEKALELVGSNGNDAEMLSLLGAAYERRGEMDRARDCFQRARSVWGGADPGFRALEKIESKL
jgi:tetratricopeptide (TPR) repeat protein